MTYYAVAMTVTLILCYCCTTVYPMQCGVEARGFKNARVAFLVLLPLTFLAVFRWDVGVDSVYQYTYWDAYHKAEDWDNYREFEPGFFLLTVILSKLNLPYWHYLVILSLLFMTCVSYAMAKGSVWTKWSILVFFMLFMYFASFNALRQSLAEAVSLIAWANMGYYPTSKKRDIQNLMLFLLAVTFHSTALINIPLYFICKIRFSRSGLMKFAVFAVLLTPILQVVLSFIMQLVAGDRYTFMGFALINAVLTGVLFVLCWYFYDGICALDENAYKYVNLSLCIFILLLNSGALLLPFRVFDMLKIGYIFIVPYLLKGIPQARTRLGMEFLLLLIFGAWFYNAYFVLDSSYSYYKTIFINFETYSQLP